MPPIDSYNPAKKTDWLLLEDCANLFVIGLMWLSYLSYYQQKVKKTSRPSTPDHFRSNTHTSPLTGGTYFLKLLRFIVQLHRPLSLYWNLWWNYCKWFRLTQHYYHFTAIFLQGSCAGAHSDTHHTHSHTQLKRNRLNLFFGKGFWHQIQPLTPPSAHAAQFNTVQYCSDHLSIGRLVRPFISRFICLVLSWRKALAFGPKTTVLAIGIGIINRKKQPNHYLFFYSCYNDDQARTTTGSLLQFHR